MYSVITAFLSLRLVRLDVLLELVLERGVLELEGDKLLVHIHPLLHPILAAQKPKKSLSARGFLQPQNHFHVRRVADALKYAETNVHHFFFFRRGEGRGRH